MKIRYIGHHRPSVEFYIGEKPTYRFSLDPAAPGDFEDEPGWVTVKYGETIDVPEWKANGIEANEYHPAYGGLLDDPSSWEKAASKAKPKSGGTK